MGSRQGRATSVSASRTVIGEALHGRVEIAAVGRSKYFLACRHLRFLDQGSTEIQQIYWLALFNIAGAAVLIRPTGKLRMGVMRKLPVVPLCRRPAVLLETPNQPHPSAHPVPPRGAYRDRHGRWVRDAMDALASR
jgi:hypothetical protein